MGLKDESHETEGRAPGLRVSLLRGEHAASQRDPVSEVSREKIMYKLVTVSCPNEPTIIEFYMCGLTQPKVRMAHWSSPALGVS